jgi:hypothetical protein
MPLHLVFRKVTPDGLSVEVQPFEGHCLLLLGQQKGAGQGRPVQVLGIAGEERLAIGGNWQYEYEPLPKTISITRLRQWLRDHGYVMGVFDQFGNFREAA